MIARLLLAASLAGTAPVGDGGFHRIENGRVVHVSPRPPGSGVVAFYADFDVALPGGSLVRMYLLWMGGSQYLPEVGSVCTISYRRERFIAGNWHRPLPRGEAGDRESANIVHELVCWPGAPLPPPVQRGSPSAA